MTIPAFIESLDSAPEGLRDHYKKQDSGGFVLDTTASGGWSLEQVGGLKSALSAARAEAKEATAKLGKYTADDGEMLDPGGARDAIARLAALGSEADVEAKVQAAVQGQVDALTGKHNKELAERDGRVTGLTSQLTKHVLDDALLSALMDTSDGKTAAIQPKVLAAALRDNLRVQETDGKWDVHVLAEDGNRRISPASGSQDWMTVQELVDEGRNGDLKPFFKANQVVGTGGIEGATGQPVAPGSMPQAGGVSPTERLKAFYEGQGNI
jgi:hypothetical protein|tara:strand:+ start:1578 stop:2381 length:804 start_codon:yes stop_codon:yes gene_type:complete